MLQAALIDGVSFDFVPFSDDAFVATEEDIGGRDVVEALVVSRVVVVVDERTDVRHQSFWHQRQLSLSEYQAHLVGYIMRRTCGVASAGLRVSLF